ncbi:MAG: MFS transporter, partial [Candidatus Eremiobacteraeota bacterium]|nr:MFS transporter [Candidatus Eremiobacteraeota bacterium]
RIGRPLPSDATFTDRVEAAEESRAGAAPGFAALFHGRCAGDTLALWLCFFCCLFAVYSAFSWLPAMLSAEGFAPSVAGAALTAYNLGGVFGALMCGSLIARIGSRWPMTACATGAAATALAMLALPKAETTLLIVGFGLHGLFVNAVQSTLYAVSAFLYPTLIRARGTATALGVGRLGAISSAFAGAALIALGGSTAFLIALGAVMLAVAIALLSIGKHIAPNPRMAPTPPRIAPTSVPT